MAITGTVYGDADRDGRLDRGERGLGGRTIELVDAASGEVVGMTMTNPRGEYKFDVFNGLGVGRFQVREVVPTGWTQTSKTPAIVAITRGEVFVKHVDFGNAQTVFAPHPQPPRPQEPHHDRDVPRALPVAPPPVQGPVQQAPAQRNQGAEMHQAPPVGGPTRVPANAPPPPRPGGQNRPAGDNMGTDLPGGQSPR